MQRQRNRGARRRKGFTLMEVLLVMAILIILASLVTVGYQQIRKNSQRDGARSQIHMLEQACMYYHGDVGQLPADLNDLLSAPQGLANSNSWRGPYFDGAIPKDPWGRDYKYEASKDRYDNDKAFITSYGPDGQEGTQDDVTNKQATQTS